MAKMRLPFLLNIHLIAQFGAFVLLLTTAGNVDGNNGRSFRLLDDAAADLEQDEPSKRQPTCNQCIAAVSGLQALIRSNATYEELRNAAVEVCYALVPDEGWNPDAICSLAIDTYAPHVIYVLNVSDWRAREICTVYNNCGSLKRNQAVVMASSNGMHQLVKPADGIDQPHGQRPLPTQQRRSAAQWKADNYTGTIRLVHVTDIHTDYLYAEGSPTDCDMPLCCRSEYNGTGSGRYWGDYNCNIPHRTVDLMLQHIADNHRPQIVANTGDTVQHTVWDQPLDQTIEVDEYITGRFLHYLPTSACYPVYGNHDISPTNLYNADRPEVQILNQAVFNNWSPLTGFGSEQWATFERGAYYSILNRAGLRILSYNSNFGALENFYTILNLEGPDYGNMKQFMEDTLAEARRNGEKVILLGHHPSGSGGYLIEYSQFITDIQARYADVIVLHLLGHSHSDNFAIVRDLTTGEASGVQISGPSLTSYTDINPSYRVFYLDPDTYEPLDMDTYHLDIATDGDNPTPTVKFVYRATDEYGMADVSPASFEDFVNRMEFDSELLYKYRYNLETRVYAPGPCDDGCVQRTLCGLRYTDYERRQQCFDAAP